MNALNSKASASGETLEIMAFSLHDQGFCVRTTSIREIRGYAVATPLPHAPAEVIGVMNLRGLVIPVIDLAVKLGMESIEPNERCAIIVAEVQGMALGLVVDRVSDILTINADILQPMPDIKAVGGTDYSDGIIIQPSGIICFLNLEQMFEGYDAQTAKAA